MFDLFEKRDINHLLDFSFADEGNVFQNVKKISISGAQEKYSAVIDNGRIRLAADGEQGTLILKPVPSYPFQYRNQMPINEYLTMQIANNLFGIDTASCGICYTSDRKPVFVTKRFDIIDCKKLMQEDFASLMGKLSGNGDENFKYDGSYFDIAQIISRVVTDKDKALCDFFGIVVFNYLFANGDAHLKNFSILNSDNSVSLSPAYDLLNTHLHVNDDDFALSEGLGSFVEKSDTYKNTGHPCKEDFLNFANAIGLESRTGESIVNQFSDNNDMALSYVEESALEEKPKRIYKSIILERYRRFIRE